MTTEVQSRIKPESTSGRKGAWDRGVELNVWSELMLVYVIAAVKTLDVFLNGGRLSLEEPGLNLEVYSL